MSKPAAKSEPSVPRAGLPQSLRAALPSASDLVKHLDAIGRLAAPLSRELAHAKGQGAVALARAYVVMYRAMKKAEEDLKPLEALLRQYKEVEIPAVFEADGVTSVPLAEGFRVGTSHVWRASIKTDCKEQAYAWLVQEGHADIITSTVNASTLSALAKELHEDKNVELPVDLFNAAQLPNTSVTATK